jgi:metal iron transporter
VVLLSNILAIFLQSLALKLGTVTGRDLARVSRDRLPRWLNITVYFFAEAAIIATDLAEVIGVAIALNLLSHGHIPLVAGVVITMFDVVIVLMFYNRTMSGAGSALWRTQIFEVGVAVLIVAVGVCFAIELTKISGVNVGEVFRGYLPSKTMVQSEGLYLSCGILGPYVPHLFPPYSLVTI